MASHWWHSPEWLWTGAQISAMRVTKEEVKIHPKWAKLPHCLHQKHAAATHTTILKLPRWRILMPSGTPRKFLPLSHKRLVFLLVELATWRRFVAIVTFWGLFCFRNRDARFCCGNNVAENEYEEMCIMLAIHMLQQIDNFYSVFPCCW